MTKPRLLLLSYHFPPSNASGAVRAHNIAKWLPRRGWDVTVVTPDASFWRAGDVLGVATPTLPRNGVRYILTGHRLRMLSPGQLKCRQNVVAHLFGGVCRRAARLFAVEREIGWSNEAAKALKSLGPRDVDLVLATGPPFFSFRLAKVAAQRCRRAYVLDYRDLWSANPHTKGASGSVIREERSLLSGAARITAISPSLAESLAQRFSVADKIDLVTNGFDADDMTSVTPHDFGHFAIVYTGMFYPPKRVITPILEALRRLKDGPAPPASPWAFHYYGANSAHVLAEAERLHVTDNVILHGAVSRSEALRAVKGAGVAVVIATVAKESSLSDRGIVTGKIYEAIGLGTPILAVAPDGSDIDALLAHADSGTRFVGVDVAGIEQHLRALMHHPHRPTRGGSPFDWETISTKLANSLQAALTGR